MFSQNDYIKRAVEMMSSTSCDIRMVVELLHQAIECGSSGTSSGSSKAYTILGHIASDIDAGLDGGYCGIGFYALALLHDGSNAEARTNLRQSLSDESPEKFSDDPLLRRKLERL